MFCAKLLFRSHDTKTKLGLVSLNLKWLVAFDCNT